MTTVTKSHKLTMFRRRILLALSQHPTDNLASLAREIGCLRPSLSRVMPTLEKQGLVMQDGRTWVITEQGQSLLTKDVIYEQDIEPLLTRIVDLAVLHDLPFLVVCEVDGLLKIQTHALDACSELRCAYGELTGWEDFR